MENVEDLLEKVGAIFMFCIAGTLLLFQYRELSKLITTMRENVSNQVVLYEHPMDVTENNKVSYEEIIATLICDLDYDVQVNTIYLQKESFNSIEFEFSVIPNTDFTKSYEMDSSGNIVKVIYKSL